MKREAISILLFVVLQICNLNAQQQVRGFVRDQQTHELMPFVNIAVAGTTYGTVSNQNGEFTLNLEKIKDQDSIGFYYLGYKTVVKGKLELQDGLLVFLKEDPLKIRSISIVANPLSPEALIQKALGKKAENYPVISQKREVFCRSNRASYIEDFNLKLKTSDLAEVDQKFIQQMVDSLPRYTRSYEDYLYQLYTIPPDSVYTKNKIIGIKKVILRENNGGELDLVEQTIRDLFENNTDQETFWKYKTGPVSMKDKNVKVTTTPTDSTLKSNQLADSLHLKNIFTGYFLEGDLGWNWEFIQKPKKYKYEYQGIIGLNQEDAYVVDFQGKAGADYQGSLYISTETYAILRIDYALKDRKKDKSLDLLGVFYSEDADDGLVLFEKDSLGYFLKYSMHITANSFGVTRPFELIRKHKRPIFNKKMNEIKLDLDLKGRDELTNETLVVSRRGSSLAEFNKKIERGAKPEKINSYSDKIWEGYSIIEPTKQMKEYRARKE